MKKIWQLCLLALTAVLLLAACNGKEETPASNENTESNEKNEGALQVVTTFSILHDIVTEVGGDLVNVHSMVPIGTDPHEYEPLPEDIKKATDADVLLYNGLNLEGGKDGWFFKLADSVNADASKIFEAMEGVEPEYLESADGAETEINPHAFLDPVVGIQMVENTRDALIKADAENEKTYTENAEGFLEKLREIDQMYQDKIGEIPEEDRILVTSERAFQYMNKRYGLKEGYIWEIDTEENGTPEQITSLVKFINDNQVKVLFVETNVDPRPMETVAKETGLEITAEIFSDELGHPGTDGGTYLDFLTYNINTIHDGLLQK